MQRRPQFKNYPLNIQQISQLSQERILLDKDIRENLQQIRMLNNKMAKNDYEMTYLHRLQERERILDNKRREMDQILRTHQYLQEQVNANKQNEAQFRATLANEYKSAMDDKKAKAEDQRRRKIEDEQVMLQYNQKAFQIEQQRKKRQLYENKRAVQEQLAHKQAVKSRERQQKQREKQEYNRKIAMRNSLQTQKEAVYKQYYSQFMENQNRLQTVYENKTAPHVQEKQKLMQDFVRKQQEDFAREQAKINEERANKAIRDKDMLRTYLQNQIQEKQRRKSMDLEQKKTFNQQFSQYQMTQREMELWEKNRRRQEQRRYDQQLAGQIKMRTSLTKDNSNPAHRTHNPITNPIDFKIGITNPYVLKQYEQTKERFTGDRDLKLKNLAMVGNNSLTSH